MPSGGLSSTAVGTDPSRAKTLGRTQAPGTGASTDAPVLWRELLAEARTRLARAGVQTAAPDARRIVVAAAGDDPDRLPTLLDQPATVGGEARFEAMLSARADGQPLQYVLGRWGFRSLDLLVDARVLIPRPETEVTAGWAVAEVASRSGDDPVTVVDLGTGSGAIGLAVATECPRARVHATDVSPGALAVARANLAGIGRAATRVRLHEGDWFDALPECLQGSVDVLVSNPPYVAYGDELDPVIADWEPAVAIWAGSDGCSAIVGIIDEAALWIRPGGALVLETASDQAVAMAEKAERAGFVAVRVERDLADRDRVVIGYRR